MSINFSKMKTGAHDQGIQRSKLVADDAGGYTGSQSLYMAYPMRELMIANDDSVNSLSVVASNSDTDYTITFTLLPNEVLDERLYPFTQIIVTAVGSWRYILRSGVIS